MEMPMMAFGIIALAILVLVAINRKRKFNELTQEDKDTYKNAKVKIKNISKKKKILYIVAIITIIVLTTTFAIVIEKIEEAQSNTIGTIAMYVSPQEKLYSDIVGILRACVLPVFIACAIIEYVFIKKKIKQSEELSEKEKELLNEYYITPILMYVSLCVISFLITYWLLLLKDSLKEL